MINNTHIFVVDGNRAYRRNVEIIHESLEELVVGEGLNDNEHYVISGAYILADSSLVQIVE